MKKATLLYPCHDQTGEAATWLSGQRLFMWVDIDNGTLHRLEPGGKVSDFSFPEMVTAIVPWSGHGDEVVVAMKNRIVAYNFRQNFFHTLIDFVTLHPDWRTNDCKASPDGRLFCGIMNMHDHDANASVIRVDHDGTVNEVLAGQSIPNGMVWHDGHMYYADSGRHCIEEYTYDEDSGATTFARTLVEVPADMGVPDGMTLDSEGNLWVALWGGAAVGIWETKSGRLKGKVEVPVPLVASCTFDDDGRLLITTARDGLSAGDLARYPLSGSLFMAQTSGVTPGCNHFPLIY